MIGALVFVPAGRLDWAAGWLYVAALTAGMVVGYRAIHARNPELIEHRMRLGKGTKTWDKVWLWVFSPVSLSVYVVAGPVAGSVRRRPPPAGTIDPCECSPAPTSSVARRPRAKRRRPSPSR